MVCGGEENKSVEWYMSNLGEGRGLEDLDMFHMDRGFKTKYV